MKLKRVNQDDLIILPADNARTHVRTRVEPIPLSREQQQNFKIYGSWYRPEVKQTELNQGKKLSPGERMISDKKLAEQENRENYQKRKEKEAKDLEQALGVLPYVNPWTGPAMWLGKAVDLTTIGASKGKYESWGDMVDKKTGSGEFIGELTNPGYYAGAFPKLVGKGIQSTSKYALQKAEPYLMGDKRIPMMEMYKPKQEFWNPFKTVKEPSNKKSIKLETPKPKPRYIIDDAREYTNEEIEFIKNRDVEFKTNYLDVLNAKNKGKNKFTIIPSLDNTGRAYHGRHIDLDFGLGDVKKVSRMQIGHKPDLEYIKHPSKYNPNISQITIETDPRKFRHEDSHANDLASDLLKRHSAASIVDEKHLGEINAGNFNNYGLYSKLKSEILLTPLSSENKFTKSLMANKKSFDEYLSERIKEAYGDRQLLPKDSYFDIEPIKKEVLVHYNYLTGGSEIKARLTDIKEDMVAKSIIKNETSPVTIEHIINYTPSDDHYKEIINLYKNKSDILKDLSKVGVLSTIPAGFYRLTQPKKQDETRLKLEK